MSQQYEPQMSSFYSVLEAEQDASYLDSGPAMDSNYGGPEVEFSDSELEGFGFGGISSKEHIQ